MMTESEQRAHEYTAAYASKYGITDADLLAAIHQAYLAYLIDTEAEIEAEYGANPVVTGPCSGCGCSIAWVEGSEKAGECLACIEAKAKAAATPSEELLAIQNNWERNLATWHDFILDQVECVIQHGLPAIYNGEARGFLFDLWAGDMPWQPDQNAVVAAAILRSPRFRPLELAFRASFGEDLYE